jgi:choline dehydrogenase-like flavoprotein
MATFDAIVCGSGITGGWAAKELTERGLKVLMIERGPDLPHRTGYTTEFTPPWQLPWRGMCDPKVLATTKRVQKGARMDEWTQGMFVDDEVDIYETPPESNFQWLRGYHLGGRSLMWGRQSYRMGEHNFRANALDGHGSPWPVSYADIAPWYDHVEQFIGVNGQADGVPSLPDGKYQPSMGFNAGEARFAEVIKAHYEDRRLLPGRTANLTQQIGDRTPCQNRDQCARGCSFGAYFSTQSSTLPAARATGRLTLMTDTIVESIDYDPKTKRATGVRLLDARTGARSTETARIIFLNTGSINSTSVLLRSVSEATPQGLGNSSGMLGRYVMDHVFGGLLLATIPGLDDQMYLGRKNNGIVMPRFVNMDGQQTDFLRGYSYQGLSMRGNWSDGARGPGIGATLKQSLRKPGGWIIGFGIAAECLPHKDNRVTVNFARKDKYGLPVTRIDVRWRENELKSVEHGRQEMEKMLGLLGGHIIDPGHTVAPPGMAIHEMGGACMGADPASSVTNAHNQLHDAPNVFVTDGAFMSSEGDRNPSLTYMAFTARAAASAVDMLREGAL